MKIIYTMRHIFCFVVFLFLALNATFAQNPNINDFIRTVKSKYTQLRESPSSKSASLADIPQGTHVAIFDESDDILYEIIDGKMGEWYKTYYNGAFGYVYSPTLLEEENPIITKEQLYELFAHIYVIEEKTSKGKEKDAPLYDKKEKGKKIGTIPYGHHVYAYAKYDLFSSPLPFEEEMIKVLYNDKIGYVSNAKMIPMIMLYDIDQPINFDLD